MPNIYEASLLFVSGLEGDMGQTLKSSLELKSDLTYHCIQYTAWVVTKLRPRSRKITSNTVQSYGCQRPLVSDKGSPVMGEIRKRRTRLVRLS